MIETKEKVLLLINLNNKKNFDNEDQLKLM